MELELKNSKWIQTFDEKDATEYSNVVRMVPPIVDMAEKFFYEEVKVYLNLIHETSRTEMVLLPIIKGDVRTEYEDFVSEELRNEIEELVQKTSFYKKLTNKTEEGKAVRYFIISDKDAEADYGWVYHLRNTHDERNTDYVELENPMLDDGAVNVPVEYVTEIFKEEYELVLKYAKNNLPFNQLSSLIIQNHELLENTDESKEDEEKKAFLEITLVGLQNQVDSFTRELRIMAQGDVNESERIHLDNHTYNPSLHVKMETWIHTKDMLRLFQMEKEFNLFSKIDYRLY